MSDFLNQICPDCGAPFGEHRIGGQYHPRSLFPAAVKKQTEWDAYAEDCHTMGIKEAFHRSMERARSSPKEEPIYWKHRWLDLVHRLKQFRTELLGARGQHDDRVRQLLFGYIEVVESLLFADVNGGLEDLYEDFPDPPRWNESNEHHKERNSVHSASTAMDNMGS